MTNGCKICTSPFTSYFFSDPSGSGDSCYHLSGGPNDGDQDVGITYCAGLAASCYLATPDTLAEMNYIRGALNTDVWLSGLKPAGGGAVFIWQPSGIPIDTTWCKGGCGGSEDYIRFKNGGCGGSSIFANGCLENRNQNEDNKYFCEVAV